MVLPYGPLTEHSEIMGYSMVGLMGIQTLLSLPNWNYTGITSKNKKQAAEMENSFIFTFYFSHFMNIMINMFEWKNMPDTCYPLALEQTLFAYGKAAIYKLNTTVDDISIQSDNLVHTPVNLIGGLDIYYRHHQMQGFSYNFQQQITLDNAVLIRNNPNLYPSYFMCMIFASRISDNMRIMDTYQNNMKMPAIVQTDDSTKLSMQVIRDQVSGNESVVYAHKDAYRNSDTTLYPTATQQQAHNLAAMQQHKIDLMDEFLTLIGINSANTSKRERLISSEVDSNNQYKIVNANMMLEWRKIACEEINKMFGTNISVELREYNDIMKMSEQEEETNGEVHNNNTGNDTSKVSAV